MRKTLKIVLNIGIFLVIIGFVVYIALSLNKHDNPNGANRQEAPFISRYTQELSWILPQEINRFELYNNKLYIAAGQSIYIYDTEGTLLFSFPLNSNSPLFPVRDITVTQDSIYVLYPTFIEVYQPNGELVHGWEACSPLSDYCSFALAGDFVFVTDAQNKNICQYTKEGHFEQFIRSPHGFIIPSYSFDIESCNDTVYCVNSGRNLIETYTLDGNFIAAFGGSGIAGGFFAGCCNPSYITFSPDGALITSEKGNPRICSFERNGVFREVLLNSRLMGGGNAAYMVKADENHLYIAGAKSITNYEKN